MINLPAPTSALPTVEHVERLLFDFRIRPEAKCHELARLLCDRKATLASIERLLIDARSKNNPPGFARSAIEDDWQFPHADAGPIGVSQTQLARAQAAAQVAFEVDRDAQEMRAIRMALETGVMPEWLVDRAAEWPSRGSASLHSAVNDRFFLSWLSEKHPDDYQELLQLSTSGVEDDPR
jgi:hypothetical protein